MTYEDDPRCEDHYDTVEAIETIEDRHGFILIQLFQELDKLKWSSAFVASEFENNIKPIKEKYLG